MRDGDLLLYRSPRVVFVIVSARGEEERGCTSLVCCNRAGVGWGGRCVGVGGDGKGIKLEKQ